MMNIAKLEAAKEKFLMRYPGGFSNPAMQDLAKKHKLEKMHNLAQSSFDLEQFEQPGKVIDAMSKLISQSSMVSVFEKPKFRDLVKLMDDSEKEVLATGLKEFLHGDEESGFSLMVHLLKTHQLAKWPILTVCPYYYKPQTEVFIKPTTVKGVIAHFELEGLKYSPSPTYGFYKAYREQIMMMKKLAEPAIQAENAGFCGFLMMSLGDNGDDL